MNGSKLNDEIQSFTNLLIEELTKYSAQCPYLKQYVFCVENDKWIIQSKYPVAFGPDDGYYLRNLRKLVEYIDMTFVSYKNEVRVKHASRMLIETGLTCEQVGWDCGFTSYHYFKRVFESYYKLSPRQFRKLPPL